MSGTGSGRGYQIEVDSLRAFAKQVRGLLNDFQANADGTRTRDATGVASGAFGPFDEAQALHNKYQDMTVSLSKVLNALYDVIDEAQGKAEITATNYEEQEHETTRHLTVSADDGWSVGAPPPSSAAAGPVAHRAAAVTGPATSAAGGSGTAQSW